MQNCTYPSVPCSRIVNLQWRNAMAEYRAYIIGVDGRFIGAVEFLCPEMTPLRNTKQFAVGHDVELWQGGRQIEKA